MLPLLHAWDARSSSMLIHSACPFPELQPAHASDYQLEASTEITDHRIWKGSFLPPVQVDAVHESERVLLHAVAGCCLIQVSCIQYQMGLSVPLEWDATTLSFPLFAPYIIHPNYLDWNSVPAALTPVSLSLTHSASNQKFRACIKNH